MAIYHHPLLKQIDINTLTNIDEACSKINNLKLQCKIRDNNIIVKYPKTLKYSNDDYILNSRGIIIDFNTKNIINRSLGGAVSLDTFIEKVPNWDNVVIEKCYDGTLINVYYNNNKWCVSTKFCIDADESKFRSNKTFRQLFDEASNLDYSLLDKSYTYSFLLQHVESRNVSIIKKNKIYHLESTNNVTGDKVRINIPNIESPEIIKYKDNINKLLVSSIDELKAVMEFLHWSHPGYILYSQDRKYRSKISNPNYMKVHELIKDQGNIKFMLLEALYKKKNYSEIIKYYPEYNTKLIEINNQLNNYCTSLYNQYIICKIQKKYINLENKYRKAICDLHNIFRETRGVNPNFYISFNTVCEMVRNYDTAYLYSILFS